MVAEVPRLSVAVAGSLWRFSELYKPPLSNKGGNKRQETIDVSKRKTLYLSCETVFCSSVNSAGVS